MKIKKVNHGANLFELAREKHLSIEDLKDFSSNISPYGVSQKALDKLKDNLDRACIYPDPEYRELRSAIASYCSVKSENVLIGSGATFFINSFIKLLSPKRCLIFAPSYSEYEKELKKVDATVLKFLLKEEKGFKIDFDEICDFIKKENIDTVFICNPNNPTGSVLKSEDIQKLQSATGSRFVIDETYVEFTDKSIYSSCGVADKNKNIFVIRSTSKFFATPGIRLGYAICSDDEVKQRLSDKFASLWGVNIFADILGCEMFLDTQFHKHVYEKFKQQREFMLSSLKRIDGIKPFETNGNFMLVIIIDPKISIRSLYDYALNENMILRDCSSFVYLGDRFFRVCFLDDKSNKELIELLKRFFDGKNR